MGPGDSKLVCGPITRKAEASSEVQAKEERRLEKRKALKARGVGIAGKVGDKRHERQVPFDHTSSAKVRSGAVQQQQVSDLSKT